MKLGVFTVPLGHLPFEEMLDFVSDLGSACSGANAGTLPTCGMVDSRRRSRYRQKVASARASTFVSAPSSGPSDSAIRRAIASMLSGCMSWTACSCMAPVR